MPADEVPRLVAEHADGIVHEGEPPRGVEFVDDIGQCVNQVLVAAL
jgi:hypothetical protein